MRVRVSTTLTTTHGYESNIFFKKKHCFIIKILFFTQAKQALSETIALNLAVEKAMEILTEQGLMEDTLFIVTSDHAHTMSFAGYPDRGTSIVGMDFPPIICVSVHSHFFHFRSEWRGVR